MKSHVKCQMLNVSEKGFSIVEVLVSTSIFSFILLVIISFFLSTNDFNSKAKSDSQALENARRVLDIITYEIRGAKSIYTPTTTANQLSLETIKYLPTDEITTYIDFFLCGSALCLKKESQNPVALNSDDVQIVSLSFSQALNGTKPSIQVNLTVNYNSPSSGATNYSSVNLTSTASLRSY